MCIRDRIGARAEEPVAAVEEEAARVPEIGRLDTEIALVEPVSYTHLRAHETVLDLVCRLLLEKKKNT